MIISFRFRVKEKHRTEQLKNLSWKSNQIWNKCVELQRVSSKRLGTFDFINLTKEFGKEIGIHSDTRSQICRQFIQSRDTHKKCPKFRSSSGKKRSLGWIPFISRAVQIKDNIVTYQKIKFIFIKHREFPQNIKTGCFVEDSQGRWFVVFTAEVEDLPQAPNRPIGIDLGLKDFATLSNGSKIEAIKVFRRWADKLAIAQRVNNKTRVKAIYAKIKNIRKHFHHVNSSRIARQHRTVVIGNVSSSKLAKTKMAKSVYDAGWYQFKTFLAYKVRRHQGQFIEVNEAYTSQVCSSCGSIPPESPKGITGLGIREWACSNCGTLHDRDVNAAKNILTLGLEQKPLVEESPPALVVGAVTRISSPRPRLT